MHDSRGGGAALLSKWTVVALTALALPTAALGRLRDDTFALYAGWFLQSGETKVRVDGRNGLGTEIDLGDNLALNRDDDTYVLGAEWRFASRHRLGLSSFNIKRTATATLGEDVTIKDVTFPAGSSATTTFKSTVTPIFYSYSFLKSRDSELAATVGLHWTNLRLGVVGASSTNVGTINVEASAKVDGPLPLLGLRWNYAFTSKWTMLAHGEVFYLKAGGAVKYKGSMANLRLSTEYSVFRNVSLGLSYNYFLLNADSDSADWKGKVDYKYYGPLAYVAVHF